MERQEVMVRSDHLEAVIRYSLEQVESSSGAINPLAWGDNENAIGEVINAENLSAEEYEVKAAAAKRDLINALESMLQAVDFARSSHHCDLILIPLPANYLPVEAHLPIRHDE